MFTDWYLCERHPGDPVPIEADKPVESAWEAFKVMAGFRKHPEICDDCSYLVFRRLYYPECADIPDNATALR
jgi:hypothetical protein